MGYGDAGDLCWCFLFEIGLHPITGVITLYVSILHT